MLGLFTLIRSWIGHEMLVTADDGLPEAESIGSMMLTTTTTTMMMMIMMITTLIIRR